MLTAQLHVGKPRRIFISTGSNRMMKNLATSAAKDATRIKGFDGIRAIAVMMVWLAHRTILYKTPIGSIGVSMFFCLSGFLIVDILHQQRERIDQQLTTFRAEFAYFMMRRAYRIFPVYFLFLAMIMPFAVAKGGEGLDAVGIWMHLSYVVNVWILLLHPHWNSTTTHLWSLSVEEQFYLVFSFLLLMGPAQVSWKICAAAALLGLAALLIMKLSRLNSLVGFGDIAFGGLLVLSIPRNATRHAFSWAALATALAYICLRLLLSWKLSETFADAMYNIAPILTGILLVYVRSNQHSILVRVLEFYPLRKLGLISYGFYVFHAPFGSENIQMLSDKLGLHNLLFSHYFLEFGLPLLAASISWKYIEQPILRRRPYLQVAPHISTVKVGHPG